MKNTRKQFGLAVVIAMMALNALLITGCSDGGDSDIDRWGKWVDPSSTATLDYSVDDEGVCTITVGGTPATDQWKAQARYAYTGKAGASYEYTFEAWTPSGTRELYVQYYEDNDEKIYLGEGIPITNAPTTYTVRGHALPKGGEYHLEFQCANQLGTFYVKIISIETYYDPTGIWSFNISGQDAIVIINGNKWKFDGPGTYIDDNGIFFTDGNVGYMYSYAWQADIGTATLTSNTTMVLTLHSPSLITGTYYGTKW